MLGAGIYYRKQQIFAANGCRTIQAKEGCRLAIAIVLHLDNFASVIDGLTIGLSPRSENARDIDTARKEVQALTEAVRSAGDGLNALTARCKVLDDAVAVFHGVARSRLWWLIALAFLSGAAVGWATFFIKF